MMKSKKVGKSFLGHLLSIKAVIFSIGGYFNGYEVTTVRFHADTTIYTTEHPFPPNEMDPNIREGITKAAFLEQFQALHIEDWNTEYMDDSVMDGTQWDLTIQFSDGHKPIEVGGSNAYPPNFNALQELMSCRPIPSAEGDSELEIP